jgi:subtilisin family serine protease
MEEVPTRSREMAKKALFKVKGVILAGLVIFLILLLTPLESPNVEGAEPLVPPKGFDISSGSVALRKGRGTVGNARSPHEARRHILVKLKPRTSEKEFLQHSKGRGMHRQGRVYGSEWVVMSIPEGADPRQAAATARTLPGVLRATPDFIVRINDQIPPRDPIYKYDDDPTTKPCDPLNDICEAWDLVDQWGLFKTEAEGGWVVQRGSSETVIAILDSGIDLDHDDLWGNIWTNPGEIPDNGIDDDVNGFVDDVNGADFCGTNVGDPLDDPASQDANPDIPTGGTWVEDLSAWPFGTRFDGDPAVGDAVDNDLDQLIDLGVFHGTFAAGVAGAMTDNVNPDTQEFEGMAGVCWHCKLMPVRLINAEGWAFGSDAAAAVYYATDMGADVINVSWGIDSLRDGRNPGLG